MKEKEKFIPSPGKRVHFVDESGKVVKILNMNRAERRRLKIYRQIPSVKEQKAG